MSASQNDNPVGKCIRSLVTPSTTTLLVNHKPETRTVEHLPSMSRRRLAPRSTTVARLMRRVFVYARHSTDKQDKSEERQIHDCKTYLKRRKLDFLRSFSDRGLSGTGMALRVELQAMMAAARRKECDIILVEDIDRLSRSLPDLMTIFYELKLLGIELHDIQTGKLDLIHVVIRGYMGEEGRVRFLGLGKAGKQNAVRNGKLMNKVHYGYRRHPDPDLKGVHLIDEEAAKHLIWIYRSVADGMSAGAVARKLTGDGVLPPEQRYRINRGGKVLKVKPWLPGTVMKLVRSHMPLGMVSWGKTVPVYDSTLRIRTGYEPTEEATWIIMEHKDLRIVDDELWTRANLRLSSLAYPGAQAGTRYLLTKKAHCSCGALLNVVGDENQVRYVCSDRRLRGPSACSNHRMPRVAWVERAVVERVMETVLHPTKIDGYVKDFKAEVVALLDRDVRRRKEIERRQVEIDNLQLKSFTDEATEGLAESRKVRIREALEQESDDLYKEMSDLRQPADFMLAVAALESVVDDLDRVLDEIPFRPVDAEGIAMAQAIRDAIGKVVVHQPDSDGWMKVTIEIDYLQSLRGPDEKADGIADALGRTTLETGFDIFELRRAEREARVEDGAAGLNKAADGRHDLEKRDWAVVAPFLDTTGSRVVDTIEPRLVVNGMFALAKEKGTIAQIPSRYGDPIAFRRAVKRLVYSGKWDAAVAALRRAGAACLQGARLKLFDTTDFPRRNAGVRPQDDVAGRDRARLLELAAKEPEGDPVRLRYEFVAMVLEGAPIGASAKTLGLSVSSGYHHWDNYKGGGIEALRRKEGWFKATLATKAQIGKLRAIAETGVDPDDEDAWLTYPILCRVCEERFGVVYSRGGMIQLARREGFLLAAYVARARRRKNLPVELPPLPKPRRVLSTVRKGTPASKKARRDAAKAAARGGRSP
jgi:site-specific DNA recombinase